MKKITQEAIQGIWEKYARRLDNDADPDIVLADYYEEIADLGGIVVNGRGTLDKDAAEAMLDTLRERGCVVLDDPAQEGQADRFILFPRTPCSDDLETANPDLALTGVRAARSNVTKVTGQGPHRILINLFPGRLQLPTTTDASLIDLSFGVLSPDVYDFPRSDDQIGVKPG